MGKRKKNRRKSSSSDSDTEYVNRKQCRHDTRLNTSISDAISAANTVLYEDSHDSDTNSAMATNNSSSSSSNSSNGGSTVPPNLAKNNDLRELREQMTLVLNTVTDIKSSQESMRKAFDSKLDKMRNEFLTTIDGKLRNLRDEISIDISRESSRIDNLLTNLQTLQTRIDNMEHSASHASHATATEGGASGSTEPRRNHGDRRARLDDPEVCIVASGIPFEEGENVMEKAEALIQAMGDDVSSNVLVTGAKRFKSYFEGKPGLLKVNFQNTDEKILVLKNKSTLKEKDSYKRVYVKSSKSRAERLIEQNARTLLRQLPQGTNYRVDANGRIRERREQDNHTQHA